MKWLVDHWSIIVGAALVVTHLAQAVTKHWSDYSGVKRVAAFTVDVLSIIPSSVGLKLPFVPSKK